MSVEEKIRLIAIAIQDLTCMISNDSIFIQERLEEVYNKMVVVQE